MLSPGSASGVVGETLRLRGGGDFPSDLGECKADSQEWGGFCEHVVGERGGEHWEAVEEPEMAGCEALRLRGGAGSDLGLDSECDDSDWESEWGESECGDGEWGTTEWDGSDGAVGGRDASECIHEGAMRLRGGGGGEEVALGEHSLDVSDMPGSPRHGSVPNAPIIFDMSPAKAVSDPARDHPVGISPLRNQHARDNPGRGAAVRLALDLDAGDDVDPRRQAATGSDGVAVAVVNEGNHSMLDATGEWGVSEPPPGISDLAGAVSGAPGTPTSVRARPEWVGAAVHDVVPPTPLETPPPRPRRVWTPGSMFAPRDVGAGTGTGLVGKKDMEEAARDLAALLEIDEDSREPSGASGGAVNAAKAPSGAGVERESPREVSLGVSGASAGRPDGAFGSASGGASAGGRRLNANPLFEALDDVETGMVAESANSAGGAADGMWAHAPPSRLPPPTPRSDWAPKDASASAETYAGKVHGAFVQDLRAAREKAARLEKRARELEEEARRHAADAERSCRRAERTVAGAERERDAARARARSLEAERDALADRVRAAEERAKEVERQRAAMEAALVERLEREGEAEGGAAFDASAVREPAAITPIARDEGDRETVRELRRRLEEREAVLSNAMRQIESLTRARGVRVAMGDAPLGLPGGSALSDGAMLRRRVRKEVAKESRAAMGLAGALAAAMTKEAARPLLAARQRVTVLEARCARLAAEAAREADGKRRARESLSVVVGKVSIAAAYRHLYVERTQNGCELLRWRTGHSQKQRPNVQDLETGAPASPCERFLRRWSPKHDI